MTENVLLSARGLVRQGLTLARTAEPRARPSRRAIVTDAVFAAVVLAAAVIAARMEYGVLGHALVFNQITGQSYLAGPSPDSIAGIPFLGIVAAGVVSVPLAARRRAPLTAFAVLLIGAIAVRQYATDVTFAAVICAGYSAVAHSRFRNAALVGVPFGGLVMTAGFWGASQALPSDKLPATSLRLGLAYPLTSPVGPPKPVLVQMPGRLFAGRDDTWRGVVLLVLLALVAISVIRNAMRAREARASLEAEHAAATRRAVERERARIAGELHDVVTHNVSVMIVQAGAARQVLAQAPGEARAAMLAVEASGRAAMTELRHLLGLLSPAGPGPDQAEGDDAELRPQPGLGQLQSLVERVGRTGLPVALHIGDQVPAELPPGLDLAAFRVVQEALTNVLKHAGKPRTSISLDCQDGELLVEVADAGPPIPAAAVPAVPGGGRGLIGLRERVALYGGRLEAGPQPDSGWQVQARFPVDPPPAPASPAGELAPAARLS